MLAGNDAYIPSSFESIATLSPTSGTSVTFSSIPNTYKSLQLRILAFGNSSSNNIQFNGDTGNNYANHRLYGDGFSTSATGFANQPNIRINAYSSAVIATYPTVEIIDIIDYASTNKTKTVRIFSGMDANQTSGSDIILASGLWNSTAAISSLTINIVTGSFPSGTKFALYGIKG